MYKYRHIGTVNIAYKYRYISINSIYGIIQIYSVILWHAYLTFFWKIELPSVGLVIGHL